VSVFCLAALFSVWDIISHMVRPLRWGLICSFCFRAGSLHGCAEGSLADRPAVSLTGSAISENTTPNNRACAVMGAAEA
jgi:hypothetical protein